ncbi:MAG: hypothetical protein MCM46_18705 [Candidatus Manganitrophus sp. SB1]|nr:hypothetical protein [Candidatus Manganitrophus morganii]
MANRICSRSFFMIVTVVALLGIEETALPQTTSCLIGTYDCTGNAPCAPNYVRAGVGICLRNGGTVETTGFPMGTDCTAIDLSSYGLTSVMRSATLTIDRYLSAGTAAGVYSINYSFYSDSGCTTLLAPNLTTSHPPPPGAPPGFPPITNTFPLYPFSLGLNSTETFAGRAVFHDVTSATVYLNGQTTIYGKLTINVPAGATAQAAIVGVSAYYD